MAAARSYRFGHLMQTVKKTASVCYLHGGIQPREPCSKRLYSSEPFDINAIVKSNNENKSIDSVKSPVPKRASETKSRNTKKEISEAETTDNSASELSELTFEFPDWFSVLLDISYEGNTSVDNDKYQLFKDFVEELEIRALPSVSTVLKQTEPKAQTAILKRWKKEKTKELGGEEEFQKYQKETLNRGLSLHKSIELYLRGERDFKVSETNAGYFESVQEVLQEVEDVKLLEEELAHPQMFYRGKFDCVATYRGNPCLIEWKTSSVLKPMLSNTYDQPMQVAAYLGALNKSIKLKRNNLPPLANALLVITYKDGEPATVHQMNPKTCQRYWQRWQERVYHYWTLLYQQRYED